MTEPAIKSRSRTALDLLCIGLPLVPIAIVLVVAVWSVAAWTINAQRFQAIKSDVFNDVHPNSLIARKYEDATDKTNTQELKEILAAADIVNENLQADFDHYNESLEPFCEFPPDDYFDTVASQAAQIIGRYKRIADSVHKTWAPIVFAGTATQYAFNVQFYGLRNVLACECIDAIHDKENARAIEAIELMMNFTRPESALRYSYSYNQSGQWQGAARAIVNKTLAQDVWTEEELKKLQTIFQKPANLSDEWRSHAEETFLPTTQMLFQEEQLGQAYDQGRIRLVSESVFAPSQKIELFEAYRSIANTEQPGTERHRKSVSRRSRKRVWSADQFLQLPGFSGSLKSMLLPSYEMMSMAKKNLERYREQTRLAIAVKRFKMKNGRLPDSLLELANVGVSSAYADIVLERKGDAAYINWAEYRPQFHSVEVK